MPITFNGTSGITYPDATTQNTAPTAPTTAQVLTATAGATAGAVGTYVFARTGSNPTQVLGDTIAGSSLQTAPVKGESGTYYTATDNLTTYPTLSGTWRCMGRASTTNINAYFSHTLWLRIS